MQTIGFSITRDIALYCAAWAVGFGLGVAAAYLNAWWQTPA